MSAIHMQTDEVRRVANRLNQYNDSLLDFETDLSRVASRLSSSWYGSDDVVRYQKDLRVWLKSFQAHVTTISDLSLRLSREVDEWLQVDQQGQDGFRETKIAQSRDICAEYGRIAFIVDGHTDYFLLHGIELQAYEGYLRGELTLEEALKFITEDPLKKDWVKSSLTFYSAEESGKLAVLDGVLPTAYGNFGGSMLSAEGHISGDVIYQDGAFQAKGEVGGGLYAAKGTYSADIAGVGVAAAGFIGAEATAEGALAFDPSKGELGVKGEFDAFAGGKAEASVTGKTEIAGVDASATAKGAVSYGIGVSGELDVGFSQGHLRGEVELGATLGLGLEFGVTFDVNVQQAATNILNTGQDAVDWLFSL